MYDDKKISCTSQPAVDQDIFEPPTGTFQQALEKGRDLVRNVHTIDLIYRVLQLAQDFEQIMRR